MNLKSFKQADLKGKRVFLRMDYNVPIKNHHIEDDYKITSSFSTIIDVYKMKPKCIIIGTHLGRPKDVFDTKYTVFPIYCELRKKIADLFDENVIFINNNNYREYKFLMLENLRFYPQEENKYSIEGIDPECVHYLSDFFQDNVDVVVNDAFGCLHRDCFSLTKTKKPTYAGNLVMREIEVGSKIMEENVDLLILGGCKVSDKIGIIKSLIERCRSIFIVGGLTYTFLKYRFGKEVGKSIVSDSCKETVTMIYDLAKKYNVHIHLPVDFIVEINGAISIVDEIPPNATGYDIGPKTIEKLRHVVSNHQSVFWNGTPGVFEKEEYSKGSKSLVEILADHKSQGKVVVGGGETSACVRKFSKTKKFYHVSTGGGAFLKLLSKEELPALKNILE